MKLKYFSEDYVKQTSEDDFELQDVFHYYWFFSIPKKVFIYSEAHSGWTIDISENYEIDNWRKIDMSIDDLYSARNLIETVFTGH